MNTKHNSSGNTKEEKKKENETVNGGKHDTIFEAAVDEYVVKGKQKTLHSKLHTA